MRVTILAAVLAACFIGSIADKSVMEKSLEFLSWLHKCAHGDDLKCPRSDITFWLYTRNTQNKPFQFDQFDLTKLSSAPFVKGAPLKFIVHGFSVNKDTAVNAILRPAYFAHGEYNIISVDWSPLGKDSCYYQAAQNIPTVAKCVSEFFKAVISSYQFPSVHLLGHSMGAHISAQASHFIYNLPRLTLFDPAFPLYDDHSPRLIKGVAQFIDVYHSNCELKGRRSPDGNVDVYFNNEVFQPGCGCPTSCSHERAVEYYAESITKPQDMLALPCGGWKDYVAGKCPRPEQKKLLLVGESMVPNGKLNASYLMFTAADKPYFLNSALLLSSDSDYNRYKQASKPDCNMEYSVMDALNYWSG